MDKKTFKKITKEIFTQYGFVTVGKQYVLELRDVAIVAELLSCRGIRSFEYYFSIYQLYDPVYGPAVPVEKRYDTYTYHRLYHNLLEKGEYGYGIKFEIYEEDEYRSMLTCMLHSTFDPYKENALQYLKENAYRLTLKPQAEAFLRTL